MPPSATFGVSTAYNPKEFPKAGHTPDGKQSALATDPDHQKLLEKQGFVFATFAPVKGTSNVTAGGISSAYVPKDYPRAIFNEDGKSRYVNNPGELAVFEEQGWSAKPFDIHLNPPKNKQGTTQAGAAPNAALEATIKAITDEHMALQSKHADAVANLVETNQHVDALKRENAALLLENESLKKAVIDAGAELKSAGNVSKAKLQNAFDDLKAKYEAMSVERDALLDAVSGPKF